MTDDPSYRCISYILYYCTLKINEKIKQVVNVQTKIKCSVCSYQLYTGSSAALDCLFTY